MNVCVWIFFRIDRTEDTINPVEPIKAAIYFE